MGFVWGNNEGAPPRRVLVTESMDLASELPEEEIDEEREASPTATLPTPKHVPVSIENHEDKLSGNNMLPLEQLRKEKEQLEKHKRRLSDHERKIRLIERSMHEEKREWEEESINLQLENCLLKERLLMLDEEPKSVHTTGSKRKWTDQDSPANNEEHLKHQKAQMASPSEEGTKEQTGNAGELDAARLSGEPTNLFTLLCAIEGHLRALLQAQNNLAFPLKE